jgi:hypothetical protein
MSNEKLGCGNIQQKAHTHTFSHNIFFTGEGERKEEENIKKLLCFYVFQHSHSPSSKA